MGWIEFLQTPFVYLYAMALLIGLACGFAWGICFGWDMHRDLMNR